MACDCDWIRRWKKTERQMSRLEARGRGYVRVAATEPVPMPMPSLGIVDSYEAEHPGRSSLVAVRPMSMEREMMRVQLLLMILHPLRILHLVTLFLVVSAPSPLPLPLSLPLSTVTMSITTRMHAQPQASLHLCCCCCCCPASSSSLFCAFVLRYPSSSI